MVYRKLHDHDLKDAIAHTEEAIQRALDLLKVASGTRPSRACRTLPSRRRCSSKN